MELIIIAIAIYLIYIQVKA